MEDYRRVEVLGVWFCRVPEGEFIRGGFGAPEEGPPGVVRLRAFAISETPVSSLLYRRFVCEPGWRTPPHLVRSSPYAEDEQPVVAVSWHDAAAFCEWFGGKAGLICALPTEAQWEKATRGTDGRTYPWGEEPIKPGLANINGYIGKTSPVGSYAVRSPFGLLDCIGNVWEWCSDWYAADYYAFAPEQDPKGPEHGTLRTIRGGSWRSSPFRGTCAHRCYYHPSIRSDRHGFRAVIVRDL